MKPGNVLLAEDGTPKITDFGLAKANSRHGPGDSLVADPTASGGIFGTPGYMAPEQAAGEHDKSGARIDVYALGAILYQMLTGRPPFLAATDLETLWQTRFVDPVPPARLRPGLPRDLDTICLNCLEKLPARRYPTGLALAEDLRCFRAGEPIVARPTPTWERGLKWVRRRPAAAALIVTAVLMAAALLGLGIDLWYRGRLQAAYDRKETARAAEEQARKPAEDALDQVEVSYHFHRLLLADREWEARNLNRARDLLEGCSARLRQWEWHYLRRLCDPYALALRGHTDRVNAVALSPDGQRLASASDDRTIRIWEAHTGRLVHVLDGHASGVNSVAFSPDGARLGLRSSQFTGS